MKKYINGFHLLTLALGLSFSSCSDFFDVESEHVIYADQDHLHFATDTIYSVTGILDKLQAIGDRTVLLGEARGDLMDVTNKTSADLRQLAMFNVDDDNKYNSPRDYYAVINNCNYFIAKADTSLKNNRNEYLFRGEYAAVKAIRAWTYLQLVTTYGRVPFVTEPILTKEEAELDYPKYDIKQVCNYFLQEDGLQAMVNIPYPNYGDIRRMQSRLFFIPMYLILGDLNLWAGNYLDAAMCYYNYINTRNNDYPYPISANAVLWQTTDWTFPYYIDFRQGVTDETYARYGETITLIPGDSVPSEGHFSELRDIFNSGPDNDYEVSLVPSQSLIDLSESQIYCHFTKTEDDYQVLYAPHDLEDHRSGDLRLSAFWYAEKDVNLSSGTTVNNYQVIYKYPIWPTTNNIRIYRRVLVYMRLAEALNQAGYPKFAFKILATGVDNSILTNEIIPDYPADSAKLAFFEFPTVGGRYHAYMPLEGGSVGYNTIGIHTRGSGYTMVNEYYTMPYDENIPAGEDSAALQIEYQKAVVEKMILDEGALEFAFEGYRYYDLLRSALRHEQSDPSFLERQIMNRRSGSDTGIAEGTLQEKKNWFLHWNNQIGY